MGIASLAIASALPGVAMGVGFALYLHFRRKREAPSGPRP
jgi:hypothetical protein